MAILSKILILGNFSWQIRIPHPKISKIDHLGATAASQSAILSLTWVLQPEWVEAIISRSPRTSINVLRAAKAVKSATAA